MDGSGLAHCAITMVKAWRSTQKRHFTLAVTTVIPLDYPKVIANFARISMLGHKRSSTPGSREASMSWNAKIAV